MKGVVRFVPVALFVALLGALMWRLTYPSETTIRSQLTGKPVPGFALKAALPGRPGLASADLRGKPHLVNLFASWCVPCITELPLLAQLQAEGVIVVGIDIRDRPQDLAHFLAENGNPFAEIGADTASAVQLTLGSSGVPETFVVDRRGIIRRQFIGGISKRDLSEVRASLVEAAR